MIDPRKGWEPKSDAEVDHVFGYHEGDGHRSAGRGGAIRLVEEQRGQPDDAEVDDLPDALQMSAEQSTDAVYRLFEDSRDFPSFPWASLDAITGPLAPEDMWIVAGRTGGGKSLFLQNAFDALVADGRRVLYVGLEQSPRILRVKWSCLRVGVQPRVVLKPRKHEWGTADHLAARGKVLADMRDYQDRPDVAKRALFAATRFVDRPTLEKWTSGAVRKYGTEVVIVDHIDRIHHGDGRNSFHEVSQTVRLAKELAVRHQIVMVVASQVGRPSDATTRFTPPTLHDLRGAGTKEEEADEVLAVYQPLRTDLTAKEMAGRLRAVQLGASPESEILAPATMAVKELKNRIDGAVKGRHTLLSVDRGRLADVPERDRYVTDPATRGPRP
jgi:KaiC/GvpD/RAD55 family RecA-like ATPase